MSDSEPGGAVPDRGCAASVRNRSRSSRLDAKGPASRPQDTFALSAQGETKVCANSRSGKHNCGKANTCKQPLGMYRFMLVLFQGTYSKVVRVEKKNGQQNRYWHCRYFVALIFFTLFLTRYC